MKAVSECLKRFFNKERKLKSKWTAISAEDGRLLFYHYQHLILVYNIKEHKENYRWHETRTDLRGVNAALKWLQENEK